MEDGFHHQAKPYNRRNPNEEYIKPNGKMCEIALNLTNLKYQGIYNDKKLHNSDLIEILKRANSMNIDSFIITGINLQQSIESLNLTKELRSEFNIYCTVGIHPTECHIFDETNELNELNCEKIINNLENLIENSLNNNIIIAIGELGLDYTKLHICSKENQLIGYRLQLKMACKYNLPLFLHMKQSNNDFIDILNEFYDFLPKKGVIHCFDGNYEELHKLISMNFYISVSGNSFKTKEQIELIQFIPNELLLIGTDAPHCCVRTSHICYEYIDTLFPMKNYNKFELGYIIKDRNEPIHLIQIVEILARIRNTSKEEIIDITYRNTQKLFNI